MESLSPSPAVQPLVSHLVDEDIGGFPFFNLTRACVKNKLCALCLPHDKVLSHCTAPQISPFEGPIPTPGISSPGRVTILEH